MKAEMVARWLTESRARRAPGGERTCSRMRASSLDDKITGPMSVDAASLSGRGRERARVPGSQHFVFSGKKRKWLTNKSPVVSFNYDAPRQLSR